MRIQHSAKILTAAALFSIAVPTAAAAERRYDFSELETELTAQCARGDFSGVVLVRARGRDVLEKHCGQADIVNSIPVSRATRFKIYSTSKFITALAVMRLAEQGRIRLDQPLRTYVPDAPSEWQAVTLRHLLNHSSGIPDLTEPLMYHFRADHPSALRLLLAAVSPKDRALATTPGSAFAYNNFGFELLADAAAKAAGQPFTEVVEQLVFRPAGMKTASIEAPNIVAGHLLAVSEEGLAVGYNGAPGKLSQANNWAFIQLGAGAVRASADDFVRLDEALKSGKIVSRKSFEAMQENLVRPPSGGRMATTMGFGYGTIVETVEGVPAHGHGGGNNGYISSFWRFPGEDAMMIVLSNRGFAKAQAIRSGVAKALKAAR